MIVRPRLSVQIAGERTRMDMTISTPLTLRLGIRHPILSAPMDGIAGARLTAAVSAAGGVGILGGGYGGRGGAAARRGGRRRWVRHSRRRLWRKGVAGAGGLQARRSLRDVRHRLHPLEP